MIVNNYYISDKENSWKQLMKSKILPNMSGTPVQVTSSEISPNNIPIEHSTGKAKTDASKRSSNNNEEINTTMEINRKTHVVVEPKKYHSEEGEV